MIFFNKKFGKILIIFNVENWLWTSEIGTFRSLDLDLPKTFKVKKCYLSLNQATIWCESYWKILKLYLLCKKKEC